MCSSDGSIGHVVDILHASAGLDKLQLLRMNGGNPRGREGRGLVVVLLLAYYIIPC